MWYKNYYTWFLTGGFATAAFVVPIISRYILTGKTTKRKESEEYHFFYQRDKLFSPRGDANIYTGLSAIKLDDRK